MTNPQSVISRLFSIAALLRGRLTPRLPYPKFALSLMLAAAPASTVFAAPPSAVPTFHCMSLYWNPSGASSTVPCAVRYRKLSEPANFKIAQNLFYDVTKVRYSGSVVDLTPGTVYVFELTMGGSTVETVTAATWSENFPIKNTVTLAATVPATYVITAGGSAGEGYVLYDGTANSTVINADPTGGSETDAANYCVEIKASYVILRGVVARNAKIHGVYLNANVRDVVIEGCEITNWGRINAWAGRTVRMRAPNFANGGDFGSAPLETSTETKVVLPNLGKQLDSGVGGKGNSIERIIIQGNKIHHPRYTSNDWSQPSGDYFAYDKPNNIAGFHPEGPKAVVLYEPGVDVPTRANHVIRYNEFYGDATHRFNDVLFESFGGGLTGIDCLFDTDVYGNYVADVTDDVFEVERAVCNDRVFDNYFTNVGGKSISFYQAIAQGGPFYQFRNVFDEVHNANRPGFPYSVTGTNIRANIMRRPFLPTGAHLVPHSTGRLYSYHNTYLATGDQGFPFMHGNDVPFTANDFTPAFVSRNNIYKTSAAWPVTSGPNLPVPNAPMMTYQAGNPVPGFLTFDGDIYNGSVEPVAAAAFGSKCVKGLATYKSGHGVGSSGKYQLAPGSPGLDGGVVLPNFNDGFAGAAPDSGAHEDGAADMVFGIANFTAASGSTISAFTPVADASTRSDTPTVNYGTINTLTVEQTATRAFETYLRFNVTALSGPVISAKLLLKESDAGTSSSNNGGIAVRAITGTWTETGVTWSNKPACEIAVMGSVPANSISQDQFVEIQLDPSRFAANGTYELALIGTSAGSDTPFYSREAATNKPQLVLVFGPAPPPPSELSAVLSPAALVNLAWTDNSANETGFKIERKIGAAGNWAALTTTPANATTYQDTTATGGGQYFYRVAATNSGGDSAFSNEATVTLTSLNLWRGLLGLPQDGSLDLENPSGDGTENIIKYALNLAPVAGGLAAPNSRPLANPSGTTVAELTGLPVFALDEALRGTFTFIRRKLSSSPGITYTVEWGDALTAMSTNPAATEATLALDTTWERATLTDSFTVSQKPVRFARLRITAP